MLCNFVEKILTYFLRLCGFIEIIQHIAYTVKIKCKVRKQWLNEHTVTLVRQPLRLTTTKAGEIVITDTRVYKSREEIANFRKHGYYAHHEHPRRYKSLCTLTFVNVMTLATMETYKLFKTQ